METVIDFIFLGSEITADGNCSHEIKMLAPWKKSYEQPRQHIQNQRHYIADKGPYSQSYSFYSSPVWIWELDYRDVLMPKNWCFWTVLLEEGCFLRKALSILGLSKDFSALRDRKLLYVLGSLPWDALSLNACQCSHYQEVNRENHSIQSHHFMANI